jgi:energy-coupling factor transporter ATP-binding protein EcfA2
LAKTIGNDEHVLIAGRTGSGKTVLARVYLAHKKHVAVLDTKGRFSWPEIPGTKWKKGDKQDHILLDGGENLTLTTRLDRLPHIKTPKIIYRPRFEEMTLEYYNEFYKWCYRRENTIVYTDEVMSVCKNPFTYPEYLKAIMTRGRELNVAHWGATQRPAGIAAIVISEASHFFIFDLNKPEDRETLTKISGCMEFKVKPSKVYGKHAFWYFYVDEDHAYPAKLELK